MFLGANPNLQNAEGITAKQEAARDALDVYFAYDKRSIEDMQLKWPIVNKLQSV